MLGDSIHTVKPYFGLGVNSTLEDVSVLNVCLDENEKSADENFKSWTSALPLFSARTAGDSKALVDISRGFDGGFLTFVLPLFLVWIFYKLVPKLLTPITRSRCSRRRTRRSAGWRDGNAPRESHRSRTSRRIYRGCYGWL